jgi:hypothetical protein
MSPVMEGLYDYQNATAPVNGTNEVQTLTIGGTPTGGTFKLAFDGHTTAPIEWTDTDNNLVAAIDAALEALPNIGTGGVTTAAGTVSSGIGTVTLTFGGNLAKLVVPTITVADNSLTGTSPTAAVAETTPGVTATARGAAPGARLVDTTNKMAYINTGTALEPVWSKEVDEISLNGLVFTGAAAAGACTLTGAKVGDKVVSLVNLTDAADAKSSFEAIITVADQIQQSSASNLSSKKFHVLLVVKS